MGSNYARQHSSHLELQINLTSSCRRTGTPACTATKDTGALKSFFVVVSFSMAVSTLKKKKKKDMKSSREMTGNFESLSFLVLL